MSENWRNAVSTVALFAGGMVAMLLLVKDRPPAQVQAQTTTQPPAQAVITSCGKGGLLWLAPTPNNATVLQEHCVDPKTLVTSPPPPPPTPTNFVGVACSPPGTTTPAIAFYAQAPDGKSCLNLIAVPATGGIAQGINATFSDPPTMRKVTLTWTQQEPNGIPSQHYQFFWIELLP